MNIVFLTSEISRLASTGGLGDVSAALPVALAARGHNVWRAMPMYRAVFEADVPLEDTGVCLHIPMGHTVLPAEVWSTDHGGVRTYFIRRDEFFDRGELYSLPERDYDDNLSRFTFFQKAAVALMDHLGEPVDVVHTNDWQTGLVPLYLEHGIDGMGRGATERTVCTVHNLAYQGIFPGTEFYLTNLPISVYSVECLEYYGQMNWLKAGLNTAGLVTTVSESYAQEILTEEMGCGLEGVMADLGDRLVGVLNGVDYDAWDPRHDTLIPATYSAEQLEGKTKCKQSLLTSMKLRRKAGVPLIGMVTRLADQKGIDLLAEAMPDLMERKMHFVLLGSGQEIYHKLCEEWTDRWPNRFACRLVFDNKMAHRIEAGADMFLMPSRFEPCGLNQMYSLRYGTLPVVHAVGGLQDTVIDMGEEPDQGTGFKFRSYTVAALLEATDRALACFADKPAWQAAMTRAMGEDFSWERSAAEYEDLYLRVPAGTSDLSASTAKANR